jgi:hypothetical protein
MDERRLNNRPDTGERGWLGPGDEVADRENWRGQYGGYGGPNDRGQGMENARRRTPAEQAPARPQAFERQGSGDPEWSRYAGPDSPDWRRAGPAAEPRRTYGQPEGLTRWPSEGERGTSTWKGSGANRDTDRWQNAGRINDIANYGGPSAIGEGVAAGEWRRDTEDHQPGVGAGPYAGRGPRGYRRSDERIREDVIDRLIRESWLDATDIEVQVRDGEVTLSGAVDDRRQKRLAVDLAESVSGVTNVFNQIRIGRRVWES